MSDLISRQAAIDALYHVDEYNARSIEAIKNLPSAQPEPCEDAVSRHRLLSDLKKLIVAWEKYPVMAEQIKGVKTAIGYVKTIPSVTPKGELMTNADKFKQIFGLYATELWSKTEVEFLAWLNSDFSQSDVPDMNVGDMVSRQAAMDAVEKYACNTQRTYEAIKNLPPVQPRHGKWIERGTWSEGYGMGETYGKYWACNQCGREVKGFWDECGKNFCDNCGADMRGGEE